VVSTIAHYCNGRGRSWAQYSFSNMRGEKVMPILNGKKKIETMSLEFRGAKGKDVPKVEGGDWGVGRKEGDLCELASLLMRVVISTGNRLWRERGGLLGRIRSWGKHSPLCPPSLWAGGGRGGVQRLEPQNRQRVQGDSLL